MRLEVPLDKINDTTAEHLGSRMGRYPEALFHQKDATKKN
jgi:hypothetical protein